VVTIKVYSGRNFRIIALLLDIATDEEYPHILPKLGERLKKDIGKRGFILSPEDIVFAVHNTGQRQLSDGRVYQIRYLWVAREGSLTATDWDELVYDQFIVKNTTISPFAKLEMARELPTLQRTREDLLTLVVKRQEHLWYLVGKKGWRIERLNQVSSIRLRVDMLQPPAVKVRRGPPKMAEDK